MMSKALVNISYVECCVELIAVLSQSLAELGLGHVRVNTLKADASLSCKNVG